MTGEMEYNEQFLGTDTQLAISCIVLLMLFILFIYIILSNLLVGLAVSDLASIQKR